MFTINNFDCFDCPVGMEDKRELMYCVEVIGPADMWKCALDKAIEQIKHSDFKYPPFKRHKPWGTGWMYTMIFTTDVTPEAT